MKTLKTIMIATLGFGVPTIAAVVAVPIEANAGWLSGAWKKLAGYIIEGIGEWLVSVGHQMQTMIAGQSVNIPTPINAGGVAQAGSQYGVTMSGSSLVVKNNIDVYTNDEDGTIVALKAGTYKVGDDGNANLTFVARAPK